MFTTTFQSVNDNEYLHRPGFSYEFFEYLYILNDGPGSYILFVIK